MKLPDLREAFLDGKTKLRRAGWESGRYIYLKAPPSMGIQDSSTGVMWVCRLEENDHEAEDWEVVAVS